jgi:hypothetical protein
MRGKSARVIVSLVGTVLFTATAVVRPHTSVSLALGAACFVYGAVVIGVGLRRAQ